MTKSNDPQFTDAERTGSEQIMGPRIEVLLPAVARALRARSPGQRVQMAYESNQLVRERLRAHLQFAHPEWSPEQVDGAVAKRLLHGTS